MSQNTGRLIRAAAICYLIPHLVASAGSPAAAYNSWCRENDTAGDANAGQSPPLIAQADGTKSDGSAEGKTEAKSEDKTEAKTENKKEAASEDKAESKNERA